MFDLTVIIPSHNKEQYIIKCLDSIYAQTLKVSEIIVFDDCSKDKTVEVLRDYQKTHPSLRVIASEINVGVAKARDIAIREAITDYVTVIDADDFYYDQHKLENEMQRAWLFYKKTGRKACTFSQTVLVDENGTRIDSKELHNWDKNLRLGTVARLYRYWIPRDYCFPKETYIEIGGFEINLNLYEDWDLNLRLFAEVPFLFSNGYGTAYRLETGGLSSVNYKKHFEMKKYVFEKNRKIMKYTFGESALFYATLYATYIKNRIRRH